MIANAPAALWNLARRQLILADRDKRRVDDANEDMTASDFVTMRSIFLQDRRDAWSANWEPRATCRGSSLALPAAGSLNHNGITSTRARINGKKERR
jgi:hypothetical protein